jgi:hypothetical protein
MENPLGKSKSSPRNLVLGLGEGTYHLASIGILSSPLSQCLCQFVRIPSELPQPLLRFCIFLPRTRFSFGVWTGRPSTILAWQNCVTVRSLTVVRRQISLTHSWSASSDLLNRGATIPTQRRFDNSSCSPPYCQCTDEDHP